MATVRLPIRGTDVAWRDAARACLTAGLPPEQVLWAYGPLAGDLFEDGAPPPASTGSLTVPRSFADLSAKVVWHEAPERFARLYALLWRLRTAPGLMSDQGDWHVGQLREMEKSVRRDMHKMKAFLRFREIAPLGEDGDWPPLADRKTDVPPAAGEPSAPSATGKPSAPSATGEPSAPSATGEPSAPSARRRFAAWFEPQHHIAEPMAGFFARRFGDMDWVIATPDLTVHFENGAVRLADGQPRPDIPDDAHEELWTTYFRHIFNPARLKVKAMQAEMPKKYWKNMPEAAAIPDMIAGAEARARAMQAAAPTLAPARATKISERLRMSDDTPPATDLDALAREVSGCTRCPLHRNATQAVMGEGPTDAPLMVVGEQPGDQEDLAGRPFVGPAGQLFDRMAGEVGLDRTKTFVTNAVKHFKFTPRGKRRIHQNPDRGEVTACRWWLDAERQLVRPKLILAMGGTAAEALTGQKAGIMKRRGTVEELADGTPVLLTLHPSYLLRVPNEAARAAAERDFRADLEMAVDRLPEIAV